MSVRRLMLTAGAMAAVAVALTALAPPFPATIEALADPQRTVDRAGPEPLVLAVTGLLAWLCWAWGALGLALTAASALPGLLGHLAGTALTVVLPAGARRSAAVLLGLGVGVTAPLVATALPSVSVAWAAPDRSGASVPDWPSAARGTAHPVPDWPARSADRSPLPAPGAHVVVRGDCLWSIGETWLTGRLGRTPTTGEVAAAVEDWWAANGGVIGPDPDLLLPGQVLRPPSDA